MQDIKKIYNLDAEKAVLGGLMLDSNSIFQVVDILKSSDFYSLSNEKIFSTMLELSKRNEPFDILTLSARLKDKNLLEEVGGYTYLSSLTDFISSTVEIRHYAKIVKEKAVLRQLLNISSEINSKIEKGDDTVEGILDWSQRSLLDISEYRVERRFESVDTIIENCMETIDKLSKKKGEYTGIPTGFIDLDKLTHGFQPSDLIVIGARPSMGKSALGLNIAVNAAKRGVPVGFISLEMNKEQLGMRILSAESDIPLHKLRSGEIYKKEDWNRLQEAAANTIEIPLYIDDSPGISLFELKIKARRLIHEHKIGMLIIDYLQMIRGEGRPESREREISEISRGLKNLAKELNIPVVALSQLNREVEKKSDKRPNLSDLRESGAIEQDADVVMFIYREVLYNSEIPDEKQNMAELIVAKQRNGPIGTIDLIFLGDFTRFESYSREEVEQLF